MGRQVTKETFTAAHPAPAEQLALRYTSINVEFELSDPELVTEIRKQPPESRDRYLKEALRLGILAMRMANGHVDASVVRRAGDKLVSDFRETLATRGGELTGQMASALGRYFDPESGLLQQRLRALVERDGELERVLRHHVEGDDSVLAKTLSSHLGSESPLFKLLSPEQAGGVRDQLEKTLEHALAGQREIILGEFSLDKKESALRRLVEELEGKHAELKTDLKGQVDTVVSEFSLDKPDSALSRLVGRVENAQRTITDEFSLDRETSALSRMARMIGDFRTEVRESLVSIGAHREEAKRSTRHGFDFEDRVGSEVAYLAQRLGDVYNATGSSTGTIKNCKVGDVVVELGPDSPAPGARIVWEAKQAQGYDLRKALSEIERGRKNRSGQVGVFVFSSEVAPAGLEPFARYGDDIVISWDPEDSGQEVLIAAAYTTARALALRVREVSGEAEVAAKEIERATRTIEKQIRHLAEIHKMAETTRSHSEKISDRVRRMRADLEVEIARIDDHLNDLSIAT